MLAALIIILVICIIILIVWNIFFKGANKHDGGLMMSNNTKNSENLCPCEELSKYLHEKNELSNHYILVLYSNSSSSELESLKDKMHLNNKKICNSFAKMYGPDNAVKLNELLTEECDAHCAFLNNAKNKLPCERLVSEWYQCGNKTCDFLCSVNHKLDDKNLIILIKEHKDSQIYHAQSLSSGDTAPVVNDLSNNCKNTFNNFSNYLSTNLLADKPNWVIS